MNYSDWHALNNVDEINRNSDRDNAIKETRDLLIKMQEDSQEESAINSKRFTIQIVISVASLIAAVVAAVGTIISLL